MSEADIIQAFRGMQMLDSHTLPQQKAMIRKALISIGTNCDQNDTDPYGDGDQSLITSRKGRDLARAHIFAVGGDVHEHLANQGSLSDFVTVLMMGLVPRIQAKIDEAMKGFKGSPSRNVKLQQLFEKRETSMRLSPLLFLVSAGKNISLSGQHESVFQKGQQECAKLLLKYGANPYAKDVLGKTVCHYGGGAMATETTLNIVDMCIEAGKTHHLCGREVELHGLKSENWNGKRGIAGGFSVETGRRLVYFEDSDEQKTLKAENLRVVDGEVKEFQCLTDVQDRFGGISLTEVVMNDRVDVARLLLKKHKTNVYSEDLDGCSPYSMSVGLGKMMSKVCFLVMDAASKHGKTEAKSQKGRCSQCGKEDCKFKCDRCRKVYYCGAACQKAHYKTHKKECALFADGVRVDPSDCKGRYVPLMNFKTRESSFPTNDPKKGYRKPLGVAVDQKFTVKVQNSSDRIDIILYDESRKCNFSIAPGSSGFNEIVQEMRKERTWEGKKSFMKASFDASGKCTIYPKNIPPSRW